MSSGSKTVVCCAIAFVIGMAMSAISFPLTCYWVVYGPWYYFVYETQMLSNALFTALYVALWGMCGVACYGGALLVLRLRRAVREGVLSPENSLAKVAARRFLLKWGLFAVCCVVGGLTLYVVGYVGLMRRDVPAVDMDGDVAFRSSFRFAPPERAIGELSIPASGFSLLNVFFEPIDGCWRRMGGCIRAIRENEPFADGMLNHTRIKEIKVFLNPPDMFRADTYQDLARCRCIRVVPDGAARELCLALREAPSPPARHIGGTTASGVIEAVIDGGRSVFLYFHVEEGDSDVYVYPLDSPALEPMVNAHWQGTLLPWLRKYVLRGEVPEDHWGHSILFSPNGRPVHPENSIRVETE